MSVQSALTLVTPVKPGRTADLAKLLKNIQDGLDAGTFILIKDVGTIHYFRLVLLEDKNVASKVDLVLSSDYDGLEDEHLALLSAKCDSMIDQLYDCCEGYPASNERNPQSRKNYLKKWSTTVGAFYVGAPGRSLQQIIQESELRNYIWKFLNNGNWEGKTAIEVQQQVQKQVRSDPAFSWANEKIKLSKVKWWNFVFLILGAIVLLPVTLLFAVVAAVWLVVLHFAHEKKDIPLGLKPSQVDDSLIRSLEENEDFENQNQFTQIIDMKPGKMRLITIKALFIYARFRCYNEFVLGELMGIPTIHFARWRILDNKRVLFFSNFDGSWQQYLGDFIDKSGWGLTAIFSNTEKFPVSRYLFWGGAYDEEHFLAWARYTQIPTQVWYNAYPHLSIKNVNTNTTIRYELFENLTEERAKTFLNRF